MKKINLLLIILSTNLFCLKDVNSQAQLPPNDYHKYLSTDSLQHELIFLSDTQEPLMLERFFLPGYRNTEATDSLVSDISYRKPRALFILGDLVPIGSDPKKWKIIDKYLQKIKKNGTDVYAIPGNHEYIYNREEGLNNFKVRFPNSHIYGYFKIVDSVGIILINSTEIKHAKQMEMYRTVMKSLDTDSAVKFIIVSTHHSPFTSSSIVKPSKELRDSLLPTFFSTKKAVLFITGHTHHLEYFVQNGKNFLVIGGGGGLRQPLLPIKERKWRDLISEKSKPLYFYLSVKRGGNVLSVSTRGFNKDFKFFDLKILNIKRNN